MKKVCATGAGSARPASMRHSRMNLPDVMDAAVLPWAHHTSRHCNSRFVSYFFAADGIM